MRRRPALGRSSWRSSLDTGMTQSRHMKPPKMPSKGSLQRDIPKIPRQMESVSSADMGGRKADWYATVPEGGDRTPARW